MLKQIEFLKPDNLAARYCLTQNSFVSKAVSFLKHFF
jgi:hypothetical protein